MNTKCSILSYLLCILCGSLLINLVCLFIKTVTIASMLCSVLFVLVFIFELFNAFIQLFIFSVLTSEYLLLYATLIFVKLYY